MIDEWLDFDLSTVTYPRFVDFLFDRPVVYFREAFDLFRLPGIDGFIASDPAIVVDHIRNMCCNYGQLTNAYSPEQIDQGLWHLFGTMGCDRHIFDSTVNRALRIECIESMYLPFAEVAVQGTSGIQKGFFYMWWDEMLHTFWQTADNYRFDYPALTEDYKLIVDSMYGTLLRILAIDHFGCQMCALHGLGHLHHPLVAETVARYLDAHRGELTDREAGWVEECRDGKNQ